MSNVRQTRRRLLLAGAAVLTAGMLSGCGDPDDDGDDGRGPYELPSPVA